MQKYQYKIEEYSDTNLKLSDIEAVLNKRGKEGWELIDFECPTTSTWILIFKKELA